MDQSDGTAGFPITRRGFLWGAAGMGLSVVLSRSLAGNPDSMENKKTAMTSRAIPGHKETLPCIGLGTWQTFDVTGAADKSNLAQVVKGFHEGGGRVIDSSPMYGRAEAVTGEITTSLQLNAGLFLATKVWTSGQHQGEQQMQSSLVKMGRTQIDLMQVHNLVDWKTQLATIRRWKGEGRVRYDGITHYTTSSFPELERVMRAEKPDFLQIPYSIEVRDAEKRLLPLAQELGIAVIVNRPFEGGSLFSRIRSKAVPPIAEELGCSTWAQVFLKFILARPEVTVVIPATSKIGHLRENLAAGRPPFPDQKQREALLKAAEAHL